MNSIYFLRQSPIPVHLCMRSIFLCFLSTAICMASDNRKKIREAMSVPEQLAHATVRIECELDSGEKAYGTGFFYAFEEPGNQELPVLVTNKHVVATAKNVTPVRAARLFSFTTPEATFLEARTP
jgi:hypothetical protein